MNLKCHSKAILKLANLAIIMEKQKDSHYSVICAINRIKIMGFQIEYVATPEALTTADSCDSNGSATKDIVMNALENFGKSIISMAELMIENTLSMFESGARD